VAGNPVDPVNPVRYSFWEDGGRDSCPFVDKNYLMGG